MSVHKLDLAQHGHHCALILRLRVEFLEALCVLAKS